MKYKVGDKVRVRKDLSTAKRYYMDNKRGCNDVVDEMVKFAGKIVTIIKADGQYIIKGCSYSWTDEMFEPVNTQKIVITSDGVETLARLYDGNKVIKTATAKCSPDDTYDFEVGANLAYDRLMKKPCTTLSESAKTACEAVKKLGKALTEAYKNTEPKKPKYFNGKVVCVKKKVDYAAYTVGKVYEFKDGRVVIDNGNRLPEKPIKDIKEWYSYAGTFAEFIPIVE